MIPSAIVTIKELILWEYARLMSEEASGERDNWRFTLHNFEQLNSDKKRWSHILEEEVKVDPNKCAYCGSEKDLSITRIVPKEVCYFAKIHNTVRTCKKCNSSKGGKDLIEWWIFNGQDKIPRSVLAKYLKILYICHECNGTTDGCALDEYGKYNLVYLGYVFQEPCNSDKVRA
jgi:hypothetical protein